MLRTSYAWELLHNGDAARARELFLRFEQVAKRYPAPADIAGERELMALAAKKAAHADCSKKEFV